MQSVSRFVQSRLTIKDVWKIDLDNDISICFKHFHVIIRFLFAASKVVPINARVLEMFSFAKQTYGNVVMIQRAIFSPIVINRDDGWVISLFVVGAVVFVVV